MSNKLFNRPICFSNRTAANAAVDPKASLSTLGGLAVAQNVVIGGQVKANGGIDASNGSLINLADATQDGDAMNLRTARSMVDTSSIVVNQDGKYELADSAFSLPLQGGSGTPVGINLNPEAFTVFNGRLGLVPNVTLASITVGRISGLSPPTLPSDVVTRAYFDAHISGIKVTESVNACSLSAVDISSSLDGTNVDGVTLAVGNRILLAGQGDPVENGIYTVASSLPPVRSTDFAVGAQVSNTTAYVESGTVSGGLTFVVTNASSSDVVGTDALIFTKFSGNGSPTAGIGLTQNGNSISLNIDANGSGGLEVTNGTLRLTADQPGIESLGSLKALTISNHITSVRPPTAAGHLANKAYVDGLSYFRLGAGLTRDNSGSLTIEDQIALGGLVVSGNIQSANVPTLPSHVVNKGYLSSLQWLNIDGSFVKDTATQTLRLSPSQTGITTLGTLTRLDVVGPVSSDAAPTLANHLVRKSYVDSMSYLQTGPGLTASQGRLSLNGVQSFTDLSVSYNVISAARPTLSTHLTNKAYVDAQISLRSPSAATQSAATRCASGLVTFASFVNQTAPFVQDVNYVRNAQTGDTWTVVNSGVFAVTVSLALSGSSQTVQLLQSPARRLGQAHDSDSLSFTGFLDTGAVLSVITSGPLDSTMESVFCIARL